MIRTWAVAAVPPAVADGVRRIDAALRSGTTASLRDLYEPWPGAAGWARTASRLDEPAHRARLVTALRNPPQPRPEIAYRGPEQVAKVILQVSGSNARVLASNDEPEVPTGSTLPIASPRPGVVTVGRGDAATTFCGDGVSDQDCGA